jgi:outer membrane protein TolC
MTRIQQQAFTLVSATAADLQEQIERRAYELYEQRGRIHGFDIDDWLQAENEVLDARDLATAA